jgi:predicted phage terminase large subunit-like protein
MLDAEFLDEPRHSVARIIDHYNQQTAEAARNSFPIFRRTTHPGILWNPFVGRITRELQRFGEALEAGDRPKLAICTPPQHGKSLAAEDFGAWISGRNPNFKTIYASYGEDLGTRTSLNLRRLFTSRRYHEIFPHITIDIPGWVANTTLTEFAHYRGSFRSTTINGSITGLELNLGILDDFVKGRAEANSKLSRDKTWHWFTDDFLSRFAKDSALLAICTRWHIDDVLGRLKKKWPEMIILEFPAIAEKDERFRKKGEALFPQHKPLDFLLERKKVMSLGSWESEYQQNPIPVTGGIFPPDKLLVIPAFDRNEIASTVMAVDKAGTEGGDGAFTAIVVMHKMKNGSFVIEAVIRGRWNALDREKIIKQAADITKQSVARLPVRFTVVIEVEPGSGGKDSAEATIRNLAGHNVIGDKPGAGRSKEIRAEPFAAQVQGGNVWVHAGVWVPDFLEEAVNWPYGFRDQIDAAAMAFSHLTAKEVGWPSYVWDAVNR